MAKKKFVANDVAQAAYEAIDSLIADLSKQEAVDVLECIHSHVQGQIEGLQQEIEDEVE